MRTRTGAAMASVAAAAIAGITFLSWNPSGASPRAAERSSAELFSLATPTTKLRGPRVGCSRRSGGDFPGAFSDSANLVVGALVLVGGARPQTPKTIREFGGQKFPLLVKAGHTVTVQLPQGARRSAGLAYGGVGARGDLPEGEVKLRDSARRMTFVACGRDERSGSQADGVAITFWSGFVLVRKPACVPLKVYLDHKNSPRRARLSLGRPCG